MKKARILVLCTQNSCRSQIAEGLIRKKFGDRVEVFSAGADPAERVHPMAIETLKQRGVDIASHAPKSTDTFKNQSFDIVITTCDSARDACPIFPGQHLKLHWGLEDPAAAEGSREDVMKVFSDTADKLEEYMDSIEEIVNEINSGGEDK